MLNKSNKIELVSASDIRHGDTIICHDGIDRTVGNDDIQNDFFGFRLFGERYSQKVQRVLFSKWFQGEHLGYVS